VAGNQLQREQTGVTRLIYFKGTSTSSSIDFLKKEYINNYIDIIEVTIN